MDRFAFSRFSEKRSYSGSDVTTYDDCVEGVEPDETASLDKPISEDNKGFRLIQRMGWRSGAGLGKNEQGRVDPVPFELKDDYLGLGRWALELEQAADATDKRKQLEAEKEVTADLVEKYKQQAEKEHKLAEVQAEMRKYFLCELCEKQYNNYSEYDNHINSYDHHHRQRLKELRLYESGRKFGGHRSLEEEREKVVAAHMVALERARMTAQRQRRSIKGFGPGFKPIGQDSFNQVTASSSPQYSPGTSSLSGKKRDLPPDPESSAKVAEKKARIAKFGLRFQSAGTLMTVDGGQRMTPGSGKVFSYQIPQQPQESVLPAPVEQPQESAPLAPVEEEATKPKFSFELSKPKPGPSQPSRLPPKLMSRQRELTMSRAFSAESDSEDEDDLGRSLTQLQRGRGPKFKFNIKKDS